MHNVAFKKILVETLCNVRRPTRCPQPLHSVRLMVSYTVQCLRNDFFKPTLCKGGIPATCEICKPLYQPLHKPSYQPLHLLRSDMCVLRLLLQYQVSFSLHTLTSFGYWQPKPGSTVFHTICFLSLLPWKFPSSSVETSTYFHGNNLTSMGASRQLLWKHIYVHGNFHGIKYGSKFYFLHGSRFTSFHGIVMEVDVLPFTSMEVAIKVASFSSFIYCTSMKASIY